MILCDRFLSGTHIGDNIRGSVCWMLIDCQTHLEVFDMAASAWLLWHSYKADIITAVLCLKDQGIAETNDGASCVSVHATGLNLHCWNLPFWWMAGTPVVELSVHRLENYIHHQ